MTCFITHPEEGIDGEAVVEHLGTTVDLPLQTRGSEVDTFARGIKMDFLTHSLIIVTKNNSLYPGLQKASNNTVIMMLAY